jgi:hypothetical protein
MELMSFDSCLPFGAGLFFLISCFFLCTYVDIRVASPMKRAELYD